MDLDTEPVRELCEEDGRDYLMADIKSPEERSLNMAKIHCRDTKPEIWLRKRLFARGYRYRKNVNSIAGHPDLWLRRYDTVIFVHGCFWHRHNSCKYAYMPKSRIEFWTDKFGRNISRDNQVREQLRNEGIRILIVWECTIKKMVRYPETELDITQKIEEFLRSAEEYLEL